MSESPSRFTRRGFVMTGGGAKGLYEAGVIHAFHLCGIEFDVITGSSIGAINAIFFGEYLYRKQRLPAEVREDPERALEAMDPLIKAFQHAWWKLPQAQIVDDSEEGPLGRLKEDLARADVDLPSLVRLGWWWTDPKRWDVPPPRVWPHMIKLGRELVERLGDGSSLFKILGREKHAPVEAALRAYLARFDLEQSLVPAQPNVLREFFSRPVRPLHLDHLLDPDHRQEADEEVVLIDPERSMRDYRDSGIDVRLTRANYRTGRLELSAYTRLDEFIRFLEGRDPTKPIVIGSTRVVVPGNPNAINAAVASGRFPGVFAPFPVVDIYPEPADPQGEPENALLHELLEQGLESEAVRERLYEQYSEMNPELPARELDYLWEHMYPLWTGVPFPRRGDTYIDGGAIDNTPTNSAIDAIRETLDREGKSRRDYELDLYVVFLHSEPNPGVATTYDDPALYQVVARTLRIQGAAKMTSDAGIVRTINRFGKEAEELGRQVQILLDSVEEGLGKLGDALPDTLDDAQKQALLQELRQGLYDALLEQGETRAFKDLQGQEVETLLGQIKERSQEIVRRRLPLHVTPVEIYPDEMRLDTLQFTERLGFRRENAVEGMTMGCYNTFWRLRGHLEAKEAVGPLDDVDRRALALLRKWMGFDEWPQSEKESQSLQEEWQCQRTACVFHAMHCRHGRRLRRVVEVSVSRAEG